jgi:PAS domain S-box-containing protein
MTLTLEHATAQERILGENDFIVSKTDLKGRITYGNRTFAQYAGFAEKEFLGKNHNIVRHPDMPKAVFKFLWDNIEQGREVFAYVKNRSRDGGYYWVFANVTPSYDAHGQIIGYYSVRRKANPKAIQQMAGIYRQMLQIEKSAGSVKDGTAQSLAWLVEQLQSMGTDYEHFIFGLQKS